MLNSVETRLILDEIDILVEQNSSYENKPETIYAELVDRNIDKLLFLQEVLQKEKRRLSIPQLTLLRY